MATDIIYDENGDVACENGDFVIGVSDEQHVEDILVSHKGHYKQFPFTGVGIVDFLHGPLILGERDSLKRDIALQLEADGMKRVRIEVNEAGSVTIKGNYQ